MKRPLIMGCRGGMGQRYSAILRHLGIEFLGIDVGDPMPPKSQFDGAIIVTPTLNHIAHVRRVAELGVPILVEKPIDTNTPEVLDLVWDCEQEGVPLRMVNQYEFLATKPRPPGESHYDFFRHGNDGLAWDCINIVGLAAGDVSLKETSPVWTCVINGQDINILDMDHAYISMIRSWVGGAHENYDYIRSAHTKVDEYLQCRN